MTAQELFRRAQELVEEARRSGMDNETIREEITGALDDILGSEENEDDSLE